MEWVENRFSCFWRVGQPKFTTPRKIKTCWRQSFHSGKVIGLALLLERICSETLSDPPTKSSEVKRVEICVLQVFPTWATICEQKKTTEKGFQKLLDVHQIQVLVDWFTGCVQKHYPIPQIGDLRSNMSAICKLYGGNIWTKFWTWLFFEIQVQFWWSKVLWKAVSELLFVLAKQL